MVDKIYLGICQGWKRVDSEGSELRKDGYSLHLTSHDGKLFSKKRIKKNKPLAKLHGHCQLDDESYICIIKKTEYLDLLRKKKEHGIWYPGTNQRCPCEGCWLPPRYEG